MPVNDGFFQKKTNINFVIKNVSPQQKTLRIFNYPIQYGTTRDLLAIPEISESDIRQSLIKGELAEKIRVKAITIVSSSIDLEQFDLSQELFLEGAGFQPTLPIPDLNAPVLPGTGAQTISTWFVDPQNSTGVASDSNAGTSSSTPLSTFQEIVTRWGTNSPLLNQTTTITFLSNHVDNSDPVIIPKVYLGNSSNLFINGSKTQIATGTFSGTVTKNRATGQLWNVNLGRSVAPFVGKLIEDMNTGAFMWIYKDLGSNVASLSQPLAATSIAGYNVLNAELDTIANTHTYKIYDLTIVNVVEIGANIVIFDAANNFNNGIILQNIHVLDTSGVQFDDIYLGPYAGMIECSCDRIPISLETNTDEPATFHNCNLSQTFGNKNLFGGIVQFGAGGNGNVSTQFGPQWDDDVILAFGGGAGLPGVAAGFVYLDSAGGTLEVGGSLQSVSPGAIWGSGTIDLRHGGKILYGNSASATAYFLNSGGITINGGTTANSISYSGNVGTINKSITVNRTNLDAPASSTGFGGLAWDPFTGSVISNTIP